MDYKSACKEKRVAGLSLKIILIIENDQKTIRLKTFLLVYLNYSKFVYDKNLSTTFFHSLVEGVFNVALNS